MKIFVYDDLPPPRRSNCAVVLADCVELVVGL